MTAQEEGFRKVLLQVIDLVDEPTLSWRDVANRASSPVALLQPAEKKIMIADRPGFDIFRALYPEVDALGYDEAPFGPGGFSAALGSPQPH